MKRIRKWIWVVLTATVLVCAAFLAVIAASKPTFAFQFLANSRLLSDYEAIGVPIVGGEQYAQISTYRTNEPIDVILKKVEL